VLMPWPYLKMCNSQYQHLIRGPRSPQHDRWRWGVRDPLLGAPLKCEAAKQAFLAPHRCFPAAQPRRESLPSSRSHSSACRLLSVMVAAAERRAECRHLIPKSACG
jgi:hypothetical protein